MLSLAVITFTACNKTIVSDCANPFPEQYARISDNMGKESNYPIEIIITLRVGHQASECNNSCVKVGDHYTHVKCQGRGNACPVIIKIGGNNSQQKTPVFDGVVDSLWEPTHEDYYPLPARSIIVLYDSNNEISYLNIPEQTLLRDSLTHLFTITGLFFSEDPEYTNE